LTASRGQKGNIVPQFAFEIAESQVHVRRYVVEADTEEEAREMAQRGETIEEEDIKFDGVTNREITQALGQVQGSGDESNVCHVCGRPFTIDSAGVATHDNPENPDGIDHDSDADHVPYALEEES